MTKNILQSQSSSATAFTPQFYKNEFESSIWHKGYEVILERALRCPCHAPDAPLIDCQNCFGTGYFYINPLRTIALITGVNQNNQYKNWSEELLGTIAITVRDEDKANLSFLDRITIKNQYSYYSENLVVRSDNVNEFVFTTYKPVDILSIHVFVSSSEKLLKLDQFSYEINPDNPYCIILKNVTLMNGVISVYYKHEPEYRVLDLPHEIRASWVKDKKTGQMDRIQLPVQAIARRSHLITMEKPNFDGSGVIINDNI